MAFKTSHQLFRVCLWPQETGRHQVPSSGSLTGRTGAEQPTLGTKAGEHTSWLVDRTDYLKKIDFKKSCFP